MNKLKSNLKQLVKDFDISMAQLAREAKVPPQTLNNWISGLEPRSLTQVKRVANYFDISIDELCFSERPRPDKIKEYGDEIKAGVFEVVLRRVKK